MRNNIKKLRKNPSAEFRKFKKRFFAFWRTLFRTGGLPDYLIIGTQKGGTSSLRKYIEEHPDVAEPYKKEPHYFDNKYDKSINWYKRHFPFLNRFRNKISGEASPYYIYHPKVPKRVKRHLPDVKIIAVLRDPVDRAYSHYKMQRAKGLEELSFEDAIEKEQERLDEAIEKIESGGYSFERQKYSYLDRGKYSEQLKRWFDYFDDEQILIIKSEELFNDTQNQMSRVFRFLGLKDRKVQNVKIHNKGKKTGGMNPKTEKKLREYFRPYNEELSEILEREIIWGDRS